MREVISKISGVILVLFLIFIYASSQGQAELRTHRIFKISRNGLDSYLLGTIHMGVTLGQLSPEIGLLIEKSKIVMTEMDFSDNDLTLYYKNPLAFLVQKKQFHPPYVDPATVDLLVRAGVARSLAEKLSDPDCDALFTIVGFSHFGSGVDLDVLKIAHEKHIPVVALDTEQLRNRALQSLAQGVGQCSLRSQLALQGPEVLRAEILAKIKKTDLEYASHKNWPISAEAHSPMAVRTQAWVAPILAKLNQGDVFIAVGLDHLFGPYGLIHLLENHGYEVTPVLESAPRLDAAGGGK